MPAAIKARKPSCSVLPLPIYFLLVASLFIRLETALLPSTEIRRPQSYSSGALLRSSTAATRHLPNAETNTSKALLQFDARQTRNSMTKAPSLRKPATRKPDKSKKPLNSNNAAIRRPLTQKTGSSGAMLQSATRSATILQSGAIPNATKHVPNYFFGQVSIYDMMKRMHILTPYTGCSIAAFQYNLLQNRHPEFNDCFCHRGKEFGHSRGLRVDSAERLVKDGDTVYVQFNKLQHFVGMTLPHIQHDFVLISGQEQKVEQFSKEAFDAIVDNPKVIHWFMMNMDIYSYDPHHPKISPWPYGSNPKKVTEFKDELMRKVPKRDNLIYLSGFSRTTNPQRLEIPRGPKVGVEKYLDGMHASRYVISPDGDRPECYRHYEAIGLGTMPITQLDASAHSHLEGNVIFNNSVWNLTVLEATLPQNPQVNQILVFEEYWMEYVERIVGRPLRWWDPSRDALSSLAEITETVKKRPPEGIVGGAEEATSR